MNLKIKLSILLLLPYQSILTTSHCEAFNLFIDWNDRENVYVVDPTSKISQKLDLSFFIKDNEASFLNIWYDNTPNRWVRGNDEKSIKSLLPDDSYSGTLSLQVKPKSATPITCSQIKGYMYVHLN